MSSFAKPTIAYHKGTNSTADALFSIVIPSWNNLDLLKLCIHAIKTNSAFNHQIIIHVNEGNDGTEDWVKSQGFDYTISRENAGVCFAVNAMVDLAIANYILYLNDDMYVCKDWDKHLWETKKRIGHDNFYISSTLIEPKFTNNPAVLAPYDFGNSAANFNEIGLSEFILSMQNHRSWFGASWPPSLVSKNNFVLVGGYSEEFSPGFGSDPDFSMKLWQQGIRTFIGVGNSFAYHFLSKSTGRVKRNNGRKQFAQKWKVPSSYFYKYVLRMGQPYQANKALYYPKGLAYIIARLKAIYISLK